MVERTGGDLVVDTLLRAGCDVVFGLPSVHNLPIYDALRRQRAIRVVNVRHEQAALGAADGFARTTGRLGVCLTSTGPGAANAMAAQLEARLSFSPVLHVTGQIDSRQLGRQKGFIHEVPDQLAMLGSASKAAFRPARASKVPEVLSHAMAEAIRSPRGPVAVEIPIDFQYLRVEAPASNGPVPPAEEPSVDTAEIEWALSVMAGARRPLVWAGGGAVAADAGAEVSRLVRRLGAGLITTPNGRGIVSEEEPFCIGNLPWDPEVRRLCREADLLVALGTRFQGPDTENWTMELPEAIVQVDVDPTVPGRAYPVEAAVIGDVRKATTAFLEGLGSGEPAGADWRGRVEAVARSARKRLRETLGAQLGLLEGLERLLEPETVVVKDATIPAYTWGNRLLAVRRPRTSIMPNSFAIGLGLPHAIGAASASGKPVVLLVGDGGLMVSLGELATAVQEGLRLIVIVFVDGGYGVLRNIQRRQYGTAGTFGVELVTPRFAELAASFNMRSERVGTTADYEAALGRALSGPAPSLVEVDLNSIGPMAVEYTGTSRPPTH